MASMNKVILIGNLGKDPELKTFDTGSTACSFSLCTNEVWTKDGQKNEHSEWHRCVAWGKLAQNVVQYCQKGRQVCVEGRLRTRKFKDQSGVERSITEINATSVLFLANPNGNGHADAAG